MEDEQQVMDSKLNVAIIGGGLGGLALTIGLLPYRDHLNVSIYEAAPCFAEIGAGVASGPNAVHALGLISPDILERYRKCATFNETRDRDNVWLSFRYGMDSKNEDGKKLDLIYHSGEKGKSLGDISEMLTREEIRRRSCVHRARFLDEMAALVPDGIAKFEKNLVDVKELGGDKEALELIFEDGEIAFADVVIGCDGIKSATRKYVMENQSIEPHFADTYAYRAMVPRNIARNAMGDDLTLNARRFDQHGCIKEDEGHWMG
ncbi:hypothetical protein EYC80_003532 [Monilinia laxa]|uniref:FAD-binding domain-containing protein n=1 Tax=Monilinia laxa TaxID=61186 RepID=A0A5N6KK84_MONLA|nr:hypothetical protein EYC80_003532 [Monilinia laxa]